MNENVPFEERKWTEEKEIERRKWELERTRNEAERAHDKSNAFHTYVNEATIEASNLALRTLVLINGGAAVAILAFLGAVASKDKVDFDQVGRVAGTLRFYAIGVACAVAAMAFAYLANFHGRHRNKEGSCLRTSVYPGQRRIAQNAAIQSHLPLRFLSFWASVTGLVYRRDVDNGQQGNAINREPHGKQSCRPITAL